MKKLNKVRKHKNVFRNLAKLNTTLSILGMKTRRSSTSKRLRPSQKVAQHEPIKRFLIKNIFCMYQWRTSAVSLTLHGNANRNVPVLLQQVQKIRKFSKTSYSMQGGKSFCLRKMKHFKLPIIRRKRGSFFKHISTHCSHF